MGVRAGSSVIDFVMKRDRIEFLDALRVLGEGAGLEMPKFGVSKQKSGERQTLLEIQSAACGFFEKLLMDPVQGNAARQYLAERGFNEESIRRFQIGLAPDAWDGLPARVGGKEVSGAAIGVGWIAEAARQRRRPL